MTYSDPAATAASSARKPALRPITSTIKMIPQLIKDLDDAEKAIKADMQNTSGKVRGQKEKSLLEDGIF